jgi:isopentenyl-diphosphate delta-isomerase
LKQEEVILVNEHDQATGTMEKMQAHLDGALHRAFSVFVFNTKGQLLLQQRALSKYHSGGVWTNTCCSHPRPGETNGDGANRRLMEEMGLQCPLQHIFSFTYRAELDGGLTEHEHDHVFFGVSDDAPTPAPAEVMDTIYMDMNELQYKLTAEPQLYSAWLNICFDRVLESYGRFFER